MPLQITELCEVSLSDTRSSPVWSLQ